MKRPATCRIGITPFKRWAGWLLGCWLLSCWLTVLFTAQLIQLEPMPLVIIIFLWSMLLASALAMMHYGLHYLNGSLYFTGQHWEYFSAYSTQFPTGAMVKVKTILDARSKMLLQIKTTQAKKYWVIIDYIQEPAQWQSIRRALFQDTSGSS